MAVFTVIVEYGGGTYIRQARGLSPVDALKKLACETDRKVKLFRVLALGEPTLIQGIASWVLLWNIVDS